MVLHSLLTNDVVRLKTVTCDVLMWHQTLSPASSCCPRRARSQPDRDTPCACHARADAAAASFAITAAAASSACSSIFHAASRTWNHGYRACQLLSDAVVVKSCKAGVMRHSVRIVFRLLVSSPDLPAIFIAYKFTLLNYIRHVMAALYVQWMLFNNYTRKVRF